MNPHLLLIPALCIATTVDASPVGQQFLRARAAAASGDTARAVEIYESLTGDASHASPTVRADIDTSLLGLYAENEQLAKAQAILRRLTVEPQWSSMTDAQRAGVEHGAARWFLARLSAIAPAERADSVAELAGALPGGAMRVDAAGLAVIDRLLAEAPNPRDGLRLLDGLISIGADVTTVLTLRKRRAGETGTGSDPAPEASARRSAQPSGAGEQLLRARELMAAGDLARAQTLLESLANDPAFMPPPVRAEVRVARLRVYIAAGDVAKARATLQRLTAAPAWSSLSSAQRAAVARHASRWFITRLSSLAPAERAASVPTLAKDLPGGVARLDASAIATIESLLDESPTASARRQLLDALIGIGGDGETVVALHKCRNDSNVELAEAPRPTVGRSAKPNVAARLLRARTAGTLGDAKGAAASIEALISDDAISSPAVRAAAEVALLGLRVDLGDDSKTQTALRKLTAEPNWSSLSASQQAAIERHAARWFLARLTSVEPAHRAARVDVLANDLPGGVMRLDPKALAVIDRLLTQAPTRGDRQRLGDELISIGADVATVASLRDRLPGGPPESPAPTDEAVVRAPAAGPLTREQQLRLQLRMARVSGEPTRQVALLDRLAAMTSLDDTERQAMRVEAIKALITQPTVDLDAVAARIAAARKAGRLPGELRDRVRWIQFRHAVAESPPSQRLELLMARVPELAADKEFDLSPERLAQVDQLVEPIERAAPGSRQKLFERIASASADPKVVDDARTRLGADRTLDWIQAAAGASQAADPPGELRQAMVRQGIEHLAAGGPMELQTRRQLALDEGASSVRYLAGRELMRMLVAPAEDADAATPPATLFDDELRQLIDAWQGKHPDLAWAATFYRLSRLEPDQVPAAWRQSLGDLAGHPVRFTDVTFAALDRLYDMLNEHDPKAVNTILTDTILVADDLRTMQRIQWRRAAQHSRLGTAQSAAAAAELNLYMAVASEAGPMDSAQGLAEQLAAQGSDQEAIDAVTARLLDASDPHDAPSPFEADEELVAAAKALLASSGDTVGVRRKAFAMLFAGDHDQAIALLAERAAAAAERGRRADASWDLATGLAMSRRCLLIGRQTQRRLAEVASNGSQDSSVFGLRWNRQLERWALRAFVAGNRQWSSALWLRRFDRCDSPEQLAACVDRTTVRMLLMIAQLGAEHVASSLQDLADAQAQPRRRQIIEYQAAKVLYHAGFYDQTLATIDRAAQRVADRPLDYEPSFLKVMAWIKLGEFAPALQRLQVMARDAGAPTDVIGRVHFLIGWLTLQQGRIDQANLSLRRVIDLAPETRYAKMAGELIEKLETM